MRRTTRPVRRRLAITSLVLAGALLAPATASAADTPETLKLSPTELETSDTFGSAVALDGDTLVIGAMGDDDNGAQAGAAYVYVRESGGWTFQAKLKTPGSNPGDQLGKTVAISGDTVVLGSPDDWGGQPVTGSAWVFVRSGTTWTAQQRLFAADSGRQDRFGNSLAIDGDTIVVGTRDHDGARGAAYVFTRSGTTWTQQQKLQKAVQVSGDYFAASVAISGDTVIVGATEGAVFPNPLGAAYVWVRSGTTWTEQQELRPSDTSRYAGFGWNVGLVGDRAVVSADSATGPDGNHGAVYVFERSGSTWTEQQQVFPSAPFGSEYLFGYSLGFDGDSIVVATREDDPAVVGTGAAFLFELVDGTWTETHRLFASDATERDEFGGGRPGVAVAGRTVVAAAGFDDDHGGDSGSAYVFELPPPAPTPVQGFLSIKSARVSGRPGRETMTVTGTLDLGAAGADLTLPAQVDIGSVATVLASGMARDKRGRFVVDQGDLFVRVTPSRSGSSGAAFYARLRNWPDGRGPLDLVVSYSSSEMTAVGTVRLDGGRFRYGRTNHVGGPAMALQRFRASVARAGRHRVGLTALIPADGANQAPSTAPALQLFLGDLVFQVDPADVNQHPRKPIWEYRGPRGGSGVSLFRVDYGRGLVTVLVRDIDLGEVPAGPSGLLVGLGIGSDASALEVTAVRKGSALKY